LAELYVELGIGETRRIRVENGRIALAWVDWGETLIIGSRVKAKITQRTPQSKRAIAETERGELILLRGLSPEYSEGSQVTVEITRAPIGEAGRQKPAQGFLTEEAERRWTHYDRVRRNGHDYQHVRQFPVEGWDEIAEMALTGRIDFPNGSITISPTPAMTLIDVDGYLEPLALSLAAIPAIVKALDWLNIHGSIGIDFPTIQKKEDRRAVDLALSEALSHRYVERTAMNGFGFVQLVGRLDGPSILHRYSFSRTGACARMALRQAELVQGTGPVLLLTVHPALKAKLKSAWIDELARRTGRQVRIETDPSLALEAPSAQILSA
jgi:hypothetical protein